MDNEQQLPSSAQIRRPRISVIIPAYNTAGLLRKCIESLCAQTYPAADTELIIVDDGSTDDTGALADTLAAEHPSLIRVCHRPNGGSSAARNTGLSVSTGEYISFVDSDDWVDPRFLETMVGALPPDDPAVMIQIGRDEIAEDGTRLPDICIPPLTPTSIYCEEQLRLLLLHRGDASFCTKLTPRVFFFPPDQPPRLFPEGMLNEDFLLLVALLDVASRLVLLPRQYYHVYYRTGSNSRRRAEDLLYFPPVFTDIVRNADTVQSLVQGRYPRLRREAARFALYQRLEYLLHIPIPLMKRDNEFYRRHVVAYLRRHIPEILSNPHLTMKNRVYLLLFAAAPRTLRILHARLRSLRLLRHKSAAG